MFYIVAMVFHMDVCIHKVIPWRPMELKLPPQDIRDSETLTVFQSCLKTHLFSTAFSLSKVNRNSSVAPQKHVSLVRPKVEEEMSSLGHF